MPHRIKRNVIIYPFPVRPMSQSAYHLLWDSVCSTRTPSHVYVYADRVRHVCKQRTLTYPVKTPHRRIYLFEIVLTNMASMVSNESWFWTHLTIFAQMPDGYFIRFTIVNKVLAKTWFIVSTSHVEDTDLNNHSRFGRITNWYFN